MDDRRANLRADHIIRITRLKRENNVVTSGTVKSSSMPASCLERISVVARGVETRNAGGARRGAAGSRGNSNDVDAGLARRVTPVGVSSGGEEGWKREYDWFVRVAIHGGRRCRLESALFLDPERSVSLVSREKREKDERERARGMADDVEDPFRRRPQREHRGSWRRRREHRRPTNRRGLTDVATPYVTFIADALPPFLLLGLSLRSF